MPGMETATKGLLLLWTAEPITRDLSLHYSISFVVVRNAM
jgi:hypothetical protein